MTEDGKSYPIFKFDQIVDTEIGLIKVIQDKYNDRNTFYWSLLEAPIKFKIGLLYDRKHPNPLTILAKDQDNIELLDEYYQQFMTEEYVYILKHSVVTNLYTLINEFVLVKGITPIIVCKNELEVNYLNKVNKEVFSKCEIIINESYGKAIDDRSDIIYLKDIREVLTMTNKVPYKNIYIASYRFNFEDDERTQLLETFAVLLQGYSKVTSYDPYNEKDILRGK